MKFSSPTHALNWYWENRICLTNAKSHDVFCEKAFSFNVKRIARVNLSKIELLATLGYYISKLSATCRFIIECYYLHDMGNYEIAKKLNKMQNTRRFHPKLITDIYVTNLRVLRRLLNKANLIR